MRVKGQGHSAMISRVRGMDSDNSNNKDPFLTKMEFAVKMNCQSCGDKVRSKLANISGITNVVISVDEDLVLVDTVLKTSEIQELLETTGLLVFFKGFGGDNSVIGGSEQTAAVAILKGDGEQIGLLRMVQASSSRCIVEATLDELPAGEYFVNIHQLGDISLGGDSCGEVYILADEKEPVGCLGNVQVNRSGAATLHLVSEQLKVSNVIGRSVVVSTRDSKRLMCGVIARSAGLFQNPKRLCTCDGVSIWDEAKKKSSTIT